MKKRIITIVVVEIVELLAFQKWFGCWRFAESFYFNSQTLSTTLLNATNAEKGMPLLITRALHNKIVGLFWGLIQTLLQYWDIRFLIEFLSIIGGIGVVLGFWYFATKKIRNKLLWSMLLLVIFLELVELLITPHISFGYRILPIALLLQIISLFGVFQFLKNEKELIHFGIVYILIIISIISLLLFPISYQLFCLKI